MKVMFDAAAVPFFLDRSTLTQIINHKELEGAITLGVRRQELHEGGVDVINSQSAPVRKTDKMMYFEIDGVPASVRIYDTDSEMIKNTDTLAYAYEMYQIPNPVKTFISEQNKLT